MLFKIVVIICNGHSECCCGMHWSLDASNIVFIAFVSINYASFWEQELLLESQEVNVTEQTWFDWNIKIIKKLLKRVTSPKTKVGVDIFHSIC